jgi:hypothetical protein
VTEGDRKVGRVTRNCPERVGTGDGDRRMSSAAATRARSSSRGSVRGRTVSGRQGKEASAKWPRAGSSLRVAPS